MESGLWKIFIHFSTPNDQSKHHFLLHIPPRFDPFRRQFIFYSVSLDPIWHRHKAKADGIRILHRIALSFHPSHRDLLQYRYK